MKATILPLPLLISLKLLTAAGLGAVAYQKLKGASGAVARGAAAEGGEGGVEGAAVDNVEPIKAAEPEKKAQSFFDALIDKLKGTEPEVQKTALEEPKKASKPEVQLKAPDLPPPNAGLADMTKVRRQLELMRKEVDEKIVRLKLATENFEIAKKDSEEKLRIIKEEKQLLEETLQKEKVVQKERIEEALAFIEKMEPKKAAPVLEQMDRDLVIALFKKLKPKTVTKFLEGMKPKKATEYMEYYTKIRSGREYELLRDLKMCENGEIPEQNSARPSVNNDGQSPDTGQGGASQNATKN